MNFCIFEGFVQKPYYNADKTFCSFNIAIPEGDKKYTYIPLKAFKENVQKLYLGINEGDIISVKAKVNMETSEVNGKKEYKPTFVIETFFVKRSKIKGEFDWGLNGNFKPYN